LEYFNKTFCLEVEGDFACFTRPEMKVERVSYDVITPSAARAIFEAIFWKPAVRLEFPRYGRRFQATLVQPQEVTVGIAPLVGC
jgi:CRISPR-associated Cas5-like protein